MISVQFYMQQCSGTYIKTNNTGVRTGNVVTDLIALLDHECGEATGNGPLVYHDDR